ncbi:MAG: phenylalanine--tRNA ligase subunit beta [Metamycoplasmataceae bacterium]
MLFSENKLRELASLGKNIKTEEILNAINSIGFEVESCHSLSDIHGIKFGYVLKIYKNSNSDNLNVCEIEFSDKNRVIQTTAKNVKEGDYLIAFVPGSGVKGITFEAKEMKGIVSEGMLTSFDELGFNHKLLRKEWKDEIFILDEKISLDKDPIKELGLHDNIIDISILTNRSDAISYIIMAHELSAYFKTKPYEFFKIKPNINSKINMRSVEGNYISGIEANVENYKLCLDDIILLLKSNIQLEDDIKDLSSLVLIMTGVSSRIYNLEKINGEIKTSIEKNLTFNEVKMSEVLVIKNNKNILSIAGVLELPEFKYSKDNKKVLFEFASFDPKEVRDSARILKIANDSSINSSKIVSYGSIEFAVDFISTKLPSFSNHINGMKISNKSIRFEKDYVDKYAGFEITKSPKWLEVLKSLTILGFEFKDDKIIIPSYRHDISVMQDIVEEIFRFYGLNNFKEAQPHTQFNNVSCSRDFSLITSLMGYYQFWSYTLVNYDKNTFNPFSFKDRISLLTYTSQEHNSIRNSIAPSLEEIYEYNNKRKMNDINFFDIGMVNNRKALCISSDIKTYVEIKTDIFKIYGKELEIKKITFDFLHPNYNAGLFDNNIQVGWIGKMHPKISSNNLIFAEILIDQKIHSINKFEEYNSNPLKERDITIPIKEGGSIENFMQEIKKIEGIFEIKQIDSFIKENVRKCTFKIKMNDVGIMEFDKKFNI